MTIRRAHLLAASFSLLVGCLFMFYSIPIYESTIGGGGGPGAGAFPFWVGLVTTFWGAIYLRQAFQNRDQGKFITPERKQKTVLLKTAGSVQVYLATKALKTWKYVPSEIFRASVLEEYKKSLTVATFLGFRKKAPKAGDGPDLPPHPALSREGHKR